MTLIPNFDLEAYAPLTSVLEFSLDGQTIYGEVVTRNGGWEILENHCSDCILDKKDLCTLFNCISVNRPDNTDVIVKQMEE